jgi:hypothetical protein
MNQAEQSENRRAWLDLGWQIAGAVFAVAVIGAIGWLFYRVEGQPCTTNPSGAECAEVRLDVAKAEPIRNPCTSFQRVTSRRGRNCDQFYVPRRDGSRASGSETVNGTTDSGGVGEMPGSDAGQGDAPAGGDGTVDQPKPGKGGSGDPQAPEQGGGGATDTPSTPAAPSIPDQSPPPPSPPPAEPADESGPIKSTVEDTVNEVGETVKGVLDGAQGTTCKVLGGC